jgi:hypothetical protein
LEAGYILKTDIRFPPLIPDKSNVEEAVGIIKTTHPFPPLRFTTTGKAVEEAVSIIKAVSCFPPRCPRKGWKAVKILKTVNLFPSNQSVDRSGGL